jgi:hypothetical protein
MDAFPEKTITHIALEDGSGDNFNAEFANSDRFYFNVKHTQSFLKSIGEAEFTALNVFKEHVERLPGNPIKDLLKKACDQQFNILANDSKIP